MNMPGYTAGSSLYMMSEHHYATKREAQGAVEVRPQCSGRFSSRIKFAADPACVQECDYLYQQAVNYCNSLPLPQARAICFATAATAYGGCLALC